jgi:replication factor A1
MQNSIDIFYEKVKDLLSKEEFEKKIVNIQKESDYLFDENICALLIIDKLSNSNNNIMKISNLESGMESTILGYVINIGNIREFEKKNGRKGRVVNLKIRDKSGICGLVLWDKDVDLINNNIIKIDTKIKIINGYVKNGSDGNEINVGRWSLIEIVENNYISKNKLKNEKSISGRILEIQPTRPFFKDNGEYGFYTSLKIKEKNQIKKLFLWDKKVKEIQNYKSGDYVILENIHYKNNNGIIENHINDSSIIKRIKLNN